MKRGRPGELLEFGWVGYIVHSLKPAPLPPEPPIEWSGALLDRYQAAGAALARLEQITREANRSEIAPNIQDWLLKRDVLIGLSTYGSGVSLTQLLSREAGYPVNEGAAITWAPPGTAEYTAICANTWDRVANALEATLEGHYMVDNGQALTSNLMRQLHGTLAAAAQYRKYGRAKHRGAPGAFRRTPLWTGTLNRTSRPNMRVPPEDVATCMEQLDDYLLSEPPDTPAVLKAGLVHAQLDLIYPFPDDGPRFSLMLSSLILRAGEVGTNLQLQLNEQIRAALAEYYEALDAVRLDGDWEAWLRFWFTLIESTAHGTRELTNAVLRRATNDRDHIEQLGRASGSAREVHEVFCQEPVVTSLGLQQRTGLVASTVNKALRALEDLGIICEVTGNARNRWFRYDPLIEILSASTDAPARGPRRMPTVA